MKSKFLKKGQSKAHWATLFSKINDKTEELNTGEVRALDFSLRLALTNPKCLSGWSGDKLTKYDLTAAYGQERTNFSEGPGILPE
jgi:hypothetical protein